MFKTYYGPTLKAFAALTPAQQVNLADDLKGVVERFNRSGDKTMIVPSEYLQIVISRR